MELTVHSAVRHASRSDTSPTRVRQHLQALALAFLAGTAPAHALDVAGNITTNTKWSAADSPVVVSGAVTIESGATLTIEPGVIVRFEPNASLTVVDGTLSAQGTSVSPIVFDSGKPAPTSGDWGPLRFAPGTVDAGSTLTHVQVRHGEGVVVDGAAPTFNHLHLEHNVGPAITLDLAASPVGRNLSANDNGLNGILVPAGQIDGDVAWALVGIPYVLQTGTIHVGAPELMLSPNVLEIPESDNGVLELSLPFPAPDEGVSISIHSSNPAVASVPAEVFVPAEQQGTQIAVHGHAGGSVIVQAASTGYASTQSTVKVIATPQIALTPKTLITSIGGEASLTVSISDAAPAEGRLIALAATPSGRISVQDSVLIPAGESAVDVSLTGTALGEVTLQGTAPGYIGGTADIQVKVIALEPPTSLLVAPGVTRDMVIYLSHPAPPGGLDVTFDNPAPAIVDVPASVQVAAAATSFVVPVKGVAPGTSQLTASASGYASGTTQVKVQAISISPQPAAPISIPQGLTADYSIRLSTLAPPGGIDVNLGIADPGIATLSPSSVHIPAGQIESVVKFTISGHTQGGTLLEFSSPGLVGGTRPVEITAPARLEFSRTALIVGKGLNSASYPEYDIQLRLKTGNADYWTPKALDISLVNDTPENISVPTNITVSAGSNRADFRIGGLEQTQSPANVFASAPGYASPAAPLEVSVVMPEIRFGHLDNRRILTSPPDNFSVDWYVPGAVAPSRQTSLAGHVVDLAIDEANPPGIVPGFIDGAKNPITSVAIAAGATGSGLTGSNIATPTSLGTYKVKASVPGVGSWTSEEQTVEKFRLQFSADDVLGKGLRGKFVVKNTQLGVAKPVLEPLDISLDSAAPQHVGVPSIVTIPAGKSEIAFFVDGIELTEQPVAITATAEGYPASLPLSVTVTQPVLKFFELDYVRDVGGSLDQFDVYWTVPGTSAVNLNQTAIADQWIDLFILEANPPGLVPGLLDMYKNPTTQVLIAAGNNGSYQTPGHLYNYVDVPSAPGSYKVGASLAGIGTWDSISPTVVKPSYVALSKSSVVLGKGLQSPNAEVQVRRFREDGTLLKGSKPLDVAIVCASEAVCTTPPKVTIPANASEVAVPIKGTGTGNTTITLSAPGYQALSPNHATTALPKLRLDGLPAQLSSGSIKNFAVSLTVPGALHSTSYTAVAPITVELASAQSDIASVPASVVIAADATTSPAVELHGVAAGSTTVTASGVDLTPATSPTITVVDP